MAKDKTAEKKKTDKSKETILLAEDDKFLSKVLTNKLNKAGFEVHIATNGEEALSILKKEKPTLVLLDLIMPKKDGFDVLEEMKNEGLIKKVPVLILSNLGQTADIERGEKMGAVDYLVKSDNSLSEVVDKVKSTMVRFG